MFALFPSQFSLFPFQFLRNWPSAGSDVIFQRHDRAVPVRWHKELSGILGKFQFKPYVAFLALCNDSEKNHGISILVAATAMITINDGVCKSLLIFFWVTSAVKTQLGNAYIVIGYWHTIYATTTTTQQQQRQPRHCYIHAGTNLQIRWHLLCRVNAFCSRCGKIQTWRFSGLGECSEVSAFKSGVCPNLAWHGAFLTS